MFVLYIEERMSRTSVEVEPSELTLFFIDDLIEAKLVTRGKLEAPASKLSPRTKRAHIARIDEEIRRLRSAKRRRSSKGGSKRSKKNKTMRGKKRIYRQRYP